MTRLHLGCGNTVLPGWVNLDWTVHPGLDVLADMEGGLPFADGTVEHSLISHTLEHLEQPLEVMADLWRCTRPDGTVEVRVPYGSSDDAWEDPTHRRPYFLNSWGYFSQPYYWRADYGYEADWSCRRIILDLPAATFKGMSKEAVWEAVMNRRNTVSQMTADLVALKPPRVRERGYQDQPNVMLRLVAPA